MVQPARGTLPRLVVLFLFGLIAAASSSSPLPSPSAGPPGGEIAPVQRTLRLGHFPHLTHATAIGVEAGFFAKYLTPDVDLQIATFNAGPAAVQMLPAGGLDASYIGPNPTINAYVRSRGEAVRAIAGATSGSAALVARSGITSAQDLVGRFF